MWSVSRSLASIFLEALSDDLGHAQKDIHSFDGELGMRMKLKHGDSLKELETLISEVKLCTSVQHSVIVLCVQTPAAKNPEAKSGLV